MVILQVPTWWQLLSLLVRRLQWGWQSVPAAEHAAWEGSSALLSARWTPLYSQYLTHSEAQRGNMNSRRKWLIVLKKQPLHNQPFSNQLWFTADTAAVSCLRARGFRESDILRASNRLVRNTGNKKLIILWRIKLRWFTHTVSHGLKRLVFKGVLNLSDSQWRPYICIMFLTLQHTSKSRNQQGTETHYILHFNGVCVGCWFAALLRQHHLYFYFFFSYMCKFSSDLISHISWPLRFIL